jgi:hypothetical protein
MQLNSYQNFLNAEKERLNNIKQDLVSEIDNVKSELYSEYDLNSSHKTDLYSIKTIEIEEMRRKLAETSIELQEQKER